MVQKRRRYVEEEDEDEITYKRRAASQFFELEADVDSDEEENEEELEHEDGFIDDDSDFEKEDADFVFQRRNNARPQVGVEDDDDEDIDELARRLEERYGRKSRYDEEEEEDVTEVFQQSLLPTVKDSKLWLVKCAIGHEKEVAACLMQKQIDKGFNLKIKSVIALDHLKNYIYVEADKESHVREACKGMHHVFVNNKIIMVPIKEMPAVFSVKTTEKEFTRDAWVRIKIGKYKGDLAQIVNVDDIKQNVTVKLIPRIDFEALIDKLEGKPRQVSRKTCPPPRFWSASKAKALGIPVKRERDRFIGYCYYVNGMKFKDGFLYKTVSIKSISSQTQPTLDDIEKFRGAKEKGNDTTESLSISTLLAKNHKEYYFGQGDRVVVVDGDLKSVRGRVVKVDEDIVYLKPTNGGIEDLESVAINRKDLTKLFEPGDHIKVVTGSKQGETGTVISIQGNVVNVLSDKSTERFTVFADHVLESSEVASCQDSQPQASNDFKSKNRNGDRARSVTNFKYPPRSLTNFKSPPPRNAYGRGRPDPLVNARIKIRQGPYHGMTGIIVEVRGNKIRVELEAQMQYVFVDRSQIIENKVGVDNSNRMLEDYGLGCETPMHYARTPLRPWMTPTRDSLTATPIHEGMRTPNRSRAWNLAY